MISKLWLNFGIGFLLMHLGSSKDDTRCLLNTQTYNNKNKTNTNTCLLDMKCEKKLEYKPLNEEAFVDTLAYANETLYQMNRHHSCQIFNVHELFIAVNAAYANLTDFYIPLKWPQVHEVNISHNDIKMVKHRSFGNSDVRLIDMSFNLIEAIEDTAFEKKDGFIMYIDSLLLQHNKLSTISNVKFSTINKLTFMDISHNNIDELQWLERDMFDSIITIKADHNRITVIGDHFRYQQKLKILSLAGNSIKFINTYLTDLISLEALDLSMNNIESLQPNIFAGLRSLRYLNMSHNKIDAITQQYFVDSTSLSILDVSHNNIGIFSLAEGRARPLVCLMLNDNNLTEDDVFDILKFPLKVRQVHAGGNKFRCRQLIYRVARQMVHPNVKKHPEEVGEDIEIDCSSGDREEKFGVSPRHFIKSDERLSVADFNQEEDFDNLKEIMVNLSSALLEVRFYREDMPEVHLRVTAISEDLKSHKSVRTIVAVCSVMVFIALAVSISFAIWRYYPHSLNYIRNIRIR